jgi:hypothetical protein
MTEQDNGQRMDAAIADYVAGDLSDSEGLELEAQLKQDPALQREQDYWQQVLPALKQHGRPSARVPDSLSMAAVIRHRLSENAPAATARSTRPALAFPEWLRYLATAAAAAIIAVLSFQTGQSSNQPTDIVAYNEHGDQIVKPLLNPLDPHTGLYAEPYLPLKRIDRIDVHNLKTVAHQRIIRPYLGLLVKPITLDNSEHETGVLILQVMGDSPAASLGIEPGDVILSLAECPLMTSHCMLNALQKRTPGETISIVYLDSSSNTIENKQITIGSTVE